MKLICGICRGTGELEAHPLVKTQKIECPYCRGSGKIRQDKEFNEKDWEIIAYPAKEDF